MGLVNEIKKVIKKIGKKKMLLILAFILIIIFILFLVIAKPFENDKMENAGIKNIKYRVYTKDGWSKWTKNGITAGDKKHKIKNVQIKVSFKNNDSKLDYYLYNNGKWVSDLDIKNNLKNIRGFKLAFMDQKLMKKYNICYRTHTKNSNWLNWSCDGATNGIINEDINALEIKIIPKNVIMRNYLKDYEENNTISGDY